MSQINEMLKSRNRKVKTTHNTFWNYHVCVLYFQTTFLETALCIYTGNMYRNQLFLTLKMTAFTLTYFLEGLIDL